MATVYLAQDLKHRRKVAIKVLKPELAVVRETGRDFFRRSKSRPVSRTRTSCRSTIRAKPPVCCIT